MFFAASKILFLLLQPSSLAVIAIASGLAMMRRWPRRGFRLATGGLSFMVVAGLLPVGNLLLLPLEQRFANVRAPDAEPPARGIIILGGFEDGWVSGGRGGLAVNEAAERLTEGLRLARRLANAEVIFTGGVGGLLGLGEDAASPVGDFLEEAGIARDRIKLEAKPRNTHENALFTRDLVKPQAGERWLLVTSAYHMPRSVAVFRRAGFEVAAYPVDFRTRDGGDFLKPFERIPAGLERLDLAAKEWIGLVAYFVSGRTGELLPSP